MKKQIRRLSAGRRRDCLCSAEAFGLSCDNWNFNASNPAVNGGGNYNQNQNNGLFYVNGNNASNSNANIGARLNFAKGHMLTDP